MTTKHDDLDDLLAETAPEAPDTLEDLDDPIDDGRGWVLAAGSEFHVLRDGLNIALGSGALAHSMPLTRGMVVALTAETIQANTDRLGQTWLSLVDDLDGQISKWGFEMLAPNRPGPNFFPWVRGSVDAELERGRRLDVAHRIPDDEERARALDAIRRDFGRVRTSRTTARYEGGRFS